METPSRETVRQWVLDAFSHLEDEHPDGVPIAAAIERVRNDRPELATATVRRMIQSTMCADAPERTGGGVWRDLERVSRGRYRRIVTPIAPAPGAEEHLSSLMSGAGASASPAHPGPARSRRIGRAGRRTLAFVGGWAVVVAVAITLLSVFSDPAPPPEEPLPEDDPSFVQGAGASGGDLDCVDIGREVYVGDDDPHGLDGDGDGIGCEGW